MKTVTNASEIEGFGLYELTIRKPHYGDSDADKMLPFIGEVTFDGERDLAKCTIRLDANLSRDIVRALAPVIARSASNTAKKLADDAKSLANSLSSAMLKQIEAKPEDSAVS